MHSCLRSPDANYPRGLRFRLGSLPGSLSSQPAAASLPRIGWFRNRHHRGNTGIPEPYRNRDHCNSRAVLPEDASPDRAGVPNTLPGNGTVPYAFAAATSPFAVQADAAARPGAADIAPDAAAAAESTAVGAAVTNAVAVRVAAAVAAIAAARVPV